MGRTSSDSQTIACDSSRSALDFVHRLLRTSSEESLALGDLLRDLADAFSAPVAGIASFPDGQRIARHPASLEANDADSSVAWAAQADWLQRLSDARLAATFSHPHGGSCLATLLGTPEAVAWLLWLEDSSRSEWTQSEAATLYLTGQALTHCLVKPNLSSTWAAQLDRAIRRQRLQDAARVVRRVAHDFGNVLTGILGFSELALAQPLAAHSILHTYLTEVHRSAQNGAEYTNQLRLFARRQVTNVRSCQLVAVLRDEENRFRPFLGANIELQVNLPADLPLVAVEAEALRNVLAVVLDNAREAIPGAGAIGVCVREIHLNASEADAFFGSVRAGAHVEIRVADTGRGLTPLAERQLFAEPFFSTKPRQRGFGLAVAFGILFAHRGGLELLRRAEGGTEARIVLPVSTEENQAPSAPRAEGLIRAACGTIDCAVPQPVPLEITKVAYSEKE